MELSEYRGKHGVLNDEFKKNTSNSGNKFHQYHNSLVEVLDVKESHTLPLNVSAHGNMFNIVADEIDILDDNDPIINLKVGQSYDRFYIPATIQMIDYKHRKMELKYPDGGYEVVDIPSITTYKYQLEESSAKGVGLIFENDSTPDIVAMEGELSFTVEQLKRIHSNEEVNLDHVLHKKLVGDMHETYLVKNKDYGNSFSEQYNEYGILSAVIRLDDKIRRIKQLMKNPANVKDESIVDSTKDLANYSVMLWMELVKEAEQNAN